MWVDLLGSEVWGALSAHIDEQIEAKTGAAMAPSLTDPVKIATAKGEAHALRAFKAWITAQAQVEAEASGRKLEPTQGRPNNGGLPGRRVIARARPAPWRDDPAYVPGR